MAYEYKTERARLFTDDGQRQFIRLRDRVLDMLRVSGAFAMANVLTISLGESSSSWFRMACVDRMVELGEILEITDSLVVAGQNRVFVSNR